MSEKEFKHIDTFTLHQGWRSGVKYAAQGVVSDLESIHHWCVNVSGLECVLNAFIVDAVDGAMYETRAWHATIEDAAENAHQASIRFAYFTYPERIVVTLMEWDDL